MAQLNPYLYFNGTCQKAMKFYHACLGGDLELMTFAQAQGEVCPDAVKDNIMHASLKSGSLTMMASDSPDDPADIGDNVQLCINCSSLDEIETLFAALGKNGEISYPLHDTFWGARFGMLTDQFGIHWMFNFEKSKN